MCVYGLEVRYNDKTPLRCYSRERAGVFAHIYTTKGGQLRLDISVKKASRCVEYSLSTLAPGDALSFRFLRRTRSGRQSMASLRRFAREPLPPRRPKVRLGLDFRLKTGDSVRTSHPDGGGFSFMIGNMPLDHARAFVMAWNRKERWHWQLPDLHPDEEVAFQIVDTDWCDEPPVIKAQ